MELQNLSGSDLVAALRPGSAGETQVPDLMVRPPISTDLQEQLHRVGLLLGEDGYVRWQKSNIVHPRNWSVKRKSYDLSLIVMLDLTTTAISSAGTAASDQAQYKFGISRILAIFSFTSIYLIGQMFGGVVFPPYSETFGRKKLYVVSSILYSLFCLINAIPYLPAVIISRFCCGVLSAVPTNVVAGSVEDMFNSGSRIWMMYAWLVAANLGLSIGPVYGAYVTEAWGWQWVFYSAAIITSINSGLMLFIRESRPSQLLEQQVSTLRRVTGDNALRIKNPDHSPDLRTFARLTLFRPLRLFFTEPIVFVVATLSAVAYGLIYLFTEAIPIVYASFGFSPQKASLVFFAICVGILCGTFTRFYDQRLFRKRRKLRQILQPEDKLTGFTIAAPLFAIGLWWFAWTVPPMVSQVPWIASVLSMILIGYSTVEIDTTLAGYVADSYTVFSASAFAAMAFMRALFCAVFPLFAYQMFTSLGANIALTVLASTATAFCLAAALLLRNGKKIRERSPFAKYSLGVHRDHQVDRYEWENDEIGLETHAQLAVKR